MPIPPGPRPLIIALYINAAVLLALVLVLLLRPSGISLTPAAIAQHQLPIGGGGGVFIVPAQFSDRSFGCYIMDIDTQTLVAYQYFERQLRLVAARNFRWDRRLNQFNSDRPTPDEVRQLVEQEMQDARVRERNERKPDPEPQDQNPGG
jgi:hypothetical protein